MKKCITLALAAVLMALALPAAASTYLRALPAMTFPKNATYDSTEVAIPIFAVGAAVTASQDTTAWVEVGGLEFPETVAAGTNLLDFQINHQSIATSDTIGYAIQWTNDEATVAGTATKFTGLSGNGATSIAVSGNATIVNGLLSDTEAGRWVRVILWNSKVTNSNVTRKFSIIPVMRAQK